MNEVPREEWRLDTRRLGRRVLFYDCVDSTNTLAAALADDAANNGLAILANEQTAGRGQHGRSWTCLRGSGVLLSVLLFPPPRLRRPVILAAWAALAVCEVIRKSTGLEATIKWPNDVLIAGRKVCGILIEQGRGTVVGIGLNVQQSKESLAEAGLPQAASLRVFTEQGLDCRQIAKTLIEQLDAEYDLLHDERAANVEDRWRMRTELMGKEAIVDCPHGTYHGQVQELTWEGVVLRLENAELLRLVPEVVKHVIAI